MLYLWSLLIYLLILVAVGFYKSRAVKNQDDFMVAGRNLGVPVLVGTLLATWMGSGSLTGGAGLGFREGISAVWFSAGVWMAASIVFFFADRVRRFGQYTVPDILEARYNGTARILGSIVTIIAYTAIVSYQFKAGGIVLHYVTGIAPEAGVMITAAFVILFTALAGLMSVALIDTINGAVMVFGLFIAFPILLFKAGGVSGVQAAIPANLLTPMGNMTFLKAFSYSLPTMLLFLGESNMFQRFFSAKSESAAKRAVSYWIVGTIAMELLIYLLAIVGRALYPDLMATGGKSEMIIIHLARYAVPPVIGCLILAAAVSMIVSTADSFLLTPANNIVHDIYQKYINPNASQKKIVFLSRVVTVFLGLFAFLQLQYFKTILEMALYAYTMYGVGVTPAVLATFFWKRATAAGGVTSILAGMSVTLLWEFGDMGAKLGSMVGEGIRPLITETVYPALLASMGCLIVVSLLSKKPDASKWQPFFKN